jgi:hypothetical protein
MPTAPGESNRAPPESGWPMRPSLIFGRTVRTMGSGGADERPRFVEVEAPSDEEVAELLAELAKRVTKTLHAHGRLLDDECDEEAEPHLLFAGRSAPTPSGPRHEEEALPERCARRDGYSLHAGRKVHQNDRVGLEQLARYGLRPALSLERLHVAGDGTYLYEMKRRFSDGRQTLRFAPRELLLRLCALVPPRGFHMVRYHGVFAPHARGRFALTGRGMHDCPARGPCASSPSSTTRSSPAASLRTSACRLAHLLADKAPVWGRNARPASTPNPLTPSMASTRSPSRPADSVRAPRRRWLSCALDARACS